MPGHLMMQQMQAANPQFSAISTMNMSGLNNIASQSSVGRRGQASTDAVVKFLLKLRNNNINNLKNALRKLGERTQGKKDELLLRLSNKLATDEGRALVK